MIDTANFRVLRPQNIWRDCPADECFIPELNPEEIDYLLGPEDCCILPSVAAEFRYSRVSPYWLQHVETHVVRDLQQNQSESRKSFECFLRYVGINPQINTLGDITVNSDWWLVLENKNDRSNILIIQTGSLLWNVFLQSGSVTGVGIEDIEYFGILYRNPAVMPEFLSTGRSVLEAGTLYLNTGNFIVSGKAPSLH